MLESADHRPDLAGGAEQLGGLAADHGEIFVLGGRGVLGRGELGDLALGDHHGGGGEDVERAHAAHLDHHAERLAEQEVADQHARLIAPQHAGGELAAAHLAVVDHVVMQQRRGVHELDRGGELHVAIALIGGEFGGGEGQHRAQPLAAGGDQMVRHLRDHRHLRAGARQDQRIDAFHVGADELDDALQRGFGDGIEGQDDGHGDFLDILARRVPEGSTPAGAP